MTYSAVCLPKYDNNVHGFVTEDDAIQWICDNVLCPMCKEEGWDSACAAEWIVVETKKLNNCNNLGDILTAGGAVLVDK